MKTVISTIIAAAILIGLVTGLIGPGQLAFANENGEHELSLSLPSLIRPLGICALSSLLITFFTGLFRRKLGQRFLGIHKVFAFVTVVIALSHGTLVLLLF
jgi:hypothetical protein